MPGNYPEVSVQHSEHGKTLKGFPEKSPILSCDNLVANERYIYDFFTVCHLWQA